MRPVDEQEVRQVCSDRHETLGLALSYSNFFRSTTWCIRSPTFVREVPNPDTSGQYRGSDWSQTQFSAARAAQASHQKTRPTIIQAQTLNPNPQARRCQGTSRHQRVVFLGGEAGGLPPTTTLQAILGLCFYTISRCYLYHEQVSSHTFAFATTCSFSSSLPPRHTYAYTQSARGCQVSELRGARVWVLG